MPNYGMKSGLADSVKATGKRELRDPLKPEELPNSFDPQQQYLKTQEGLSIGLGDPYGDRAGHEAFALGRDTVNSNSDAVKQERIQKLYARLDEVNASIQELKVEISYQEKLKALELSSDPMWEMAKDKYIHTGDMSDLQNILTRVSNDKFRKDQLKQQQDMLKTQKEHDEAKTKEAFKQAYQTAEDGLEYAIQEARNNLNDQSVRDRVMLAYKSFKNAAFDYGYDTSDVEKTLANRYLGGMSVRQYLGLDGGSQTPAEVPPAATPVAPTGNDPQGAGSLVQATQNFEAAKAAGKLNDMVKAYKDAKAKGENPDTLNARKNEIMAMYEQKKRSYEAAKKKYERAEHLKSEWDKDTRKDVISINDFLEGYPDAKDLLDLKVGKNASIKMKKPVEPANPGAL